MSRSLALLVFPILSCAAFGQQAPVTPPVTPPMPGQLQAVSSEPTGRIPEVPKPESESVPSTPLSSNKALPSTSQSGQFIVHGNDLPLRSAFSTRCEEIHDELRTLLKDQQPWVLPVVVLLNTGEAARKADKSVVMSLSQIDQVGFHLQVSVNLRPDLRPADFRAELIRTLLFERILRQQSKIPEKRTQLLPDWVFTGVLEALDFRRQARPSALFAAIFKSGKIFGIEEIIEASPTQMDGLSKTIYQTSCCALVLALLDQPEGGARMNRFLASLGSDSRPERELLDQAFPSVASSPASLNKWWALQLASLSRPTAAEPMSAQDTVKALEEALTLRYQAKPSEIPKPRPVVARITAPPAVVQPAVARIPDKAASDKKTDDPGEAETPEDKKRSFFSRLNPFRRKSTSDEAVINAAIEDAAREEAKVRTEEEAKVTEAAAVRISDIELPDQPEDQEAQIPASEARKPFFNRWFGDSRAKSNEKPEGSDSSAPEKDSPATLEPSSESAKDPTVDKKPSVFNPRNWFRRSKAPESPDDDPMPPSEPEKTTEAAATKSAESADVDLNRWLPVDGPMIAFVLQENIVEEEAPKKKKRFGLFGGDKKPEKRPETSDDKKLEMAPTPPGSSTSVKPDPKSEGKSDNRTPETPKSKLESPITTKEIDKSTTPTPRKIEGDMIQVGDKSDVTQQPEEPKKENPSPQEDKPKREAFRLKSLFGSGKKPKEEAKSEKVAVVAEPTPLPMEERAIPTKSEPQPKSEADPITPKASQPKQEQKKAPEVKAKAEDANKLSMPKTVANPQEAKVERDNKPVQLKPTEKINKTEPKSEKPLSLAPEPLISAAVPIEDYAAILTRPDRQEILQRSLASLNALQQRSAVLFRPIVADYVAIVAGLTEGKTKNLDERLRLLRQRTQVALEQSKEITTQLDLHEVNHQPAMSGMFEDFLKLPETIKKEIPPRQDPISKYLDALDREFSRP